MISGLCCLAGQVDEKIKEFAPIYRKQYSLAYLSQIRDELEQRKEEHTQLLKQRVGIRSHAWINFTQRHMYHLLLRSTHDVYLPRPLQSLERCCMKRMCSALMTAGSGRTDI